MARFVDRVTIDVTGGNGGNGCASVHREKFKPLGGPDGGNGGHGGDVSLVVDPGVHTLLDFHYHPRSRAGNGKQGRGAHRNGAHGEDLEVRVPDGTVVLDGDGEVVADLVGPGSRLIAAQGGRGGLGNAALASRARKAPGFALLGEPGEHHELVLELKSVADVGLLGFPSAGKSSLIAVLSAAKPKIADYPFTTLAPNLGVVTSGETVFTMADVPGLIPGASRGKGLGLEFLRHIERCAALVHVVDCANEDPEREPVSDIRALETELARYAPSLADDLQEKPRVIALNKMDIPDAREMADLVRPDLEVFGWPIVDISTASRQGLKQLGHLLADLVHTRREQAETAEPARIVLRPKAVGGAEFTIEPDPETEDGYLVRGRKPERWIAQTDFDNDEAVGYLADRLARLGVEDELARQGAVPGSPVTIGEVTFDWEPSTPAGVAMTMYARGGDPRLEDPAQRPDAAQRKRAKRRRHGYEEAEEEEEEENQ